MKKLLFRSMIFLAFFAFALTPSTYAGLKKIPLVYSDHIPPMAGGNIFLKKTYFPKIQEEIAKYGYELDVTFYHAESLYTSIQQIQACEQGLMDMTVAVLPYELARFPLHEVLALGLMGWDHTNLLQIWDDLDNEIPEFNKEISKNFVEFIRFIPTKSFIHTNMGPNVRSVADFKGRKIHASGLNSDIIKYIGGVPIRQNPGDWYTSLDRGLFEGISVSFDMVGIFKLYEVLDTHIIPYHDSFGHTPVSHVFSRRKFRKLPEEVQQVIKDNLAWASREMSDNEQKAMAFYTSGAKKKGNNFIELTPEETDEWRKASKVIVEQWVKEKEKKGLPGRKVIDTANMLVEKYVK